MLKSLHIEDTPLEFDSIDGNVSKISLHQPGQSRVSDRH